MSDPITFLLGDCIERMRELEAESIDAVVTDPPSGIGFMGKDWDHHKGGREQWVAWMTEVMRECYRVLKPGGHILVWALPRTSHWTGWAIENAGFEPRDKLVHCFASGFPKSLDVSKAIDKAAGAERAVTRAGARHSTAAFVPVGTAQREQRSAVPATDAARQWDGWGTALKPAYEDWWLARKPLRGTVAANVQAWGTGALNIGATRIGVAGGLTRHTASNGDHRDRWEGNTATGEVTEHGGRWPANVVLTDELFEPGVPEVVGAGSLTGTMTAWSSSPESGPSPTDSPVRSVGAPSSHSEQGDNFHASATAPVGTQLGAWGTSTDTHKPDTGCSDGTTKDVSITSGSTAGSGSRRTAPSRLDTSSTTATGTASTTDSTTSNSSPEQSTSGSTRLSHQASSAPDGMREPATSGGWSDESESSKPDSQPVPADSPGYSRFFLIPKSPRAERERGLRGERGRAQQYGSIQDGRNAAGTDYGRPPRANVHPTVKPLELMRHLVRLVTPPGGLILDPFVGSGTTALAASEEGFRCIGIDQSAEYLEIAQGRLNATAIGMGL